MRKPRRRAGASVAGIACTILIVSLVAALPFAGFTQAQSAVTPTPQSATTLNPFDAASLNTQFELATDGPCKGIYQMLVGGRELCTYGFDQEPSLAAHPAPPLDDTQRSLSPQVQCDGDGTSGHRVQVIYAHPPGTDRYAQYLVSFQQWMADMDNIYNASAAETGGARHVRFVHDGSCNGG